MDINEFKKLSVQYEALVGIIGKINETKDPLFDEKLKLLLEIEDSIFSKILPEFKKDTEKDTDKEINEDTKFLDFFCSDWARIAELAAAGSFSDKSVSKDKRTLLEYSTSPDKRYGKDVLDISDQYQQIEKIRKTFKLVDSSYDEQLKNKKTDISGS